MGPEESPENCAQCGAAIPPGARACPDCGADERTGWRETDVYDGLDLPEDEPAARTPGNGLAWHWLTLGILVLLAIATLILRGRF